MVGKAPQDKADRARRSQRLEAKRNVVWDSDSIALKIGTDGAVTRHPLTKAKVKALKKTSLKVPSEEIPGSAHQALSLLGIDRTQSNDPQDLDSRRIEYEDILRELHAIDNISDKQSLPILAPNDDVDLLISDILGTSKIIGSVALNPEPVVLNAQDVLSNPLSVLKPSEVSVKEKNPSLPRTFKTPAPVGIKIKKQIPSRNLRQIRPKVDTYQQMSLDPFVRSRPIGGSTGNVRSFKRPETKVQEKDAESNNLVLPSFKDAFGSIGSPIATSVIEGFKHFTEKTENEEAMNLSGMLEDRNTLKDITNNCNEMSSDVSMPYTENSGSSKNLEQMSSSQQSLPTISYSDITESVDSKNSIPHQQVDTSDTNSVNRKSNRKMDLSTNHNSGSNAQIDRLNDKSHLNQTKHSRHLTDISSSFTGSNVSQIVEDYSSSNDGASLSLPDLSDLSAVLKFSKQSASIKTVAEKKTNLKRDQSGLRIPATTQELANPPIQQWNWTLPNPAETWIQEPYKVEVTFRADGQPEIKGWDVPKVEPTLSLRGGGEDVIPQEVAAPGDDEVVKDLEEFLQMKPSTVRPLQQQGTDIFIDYE